MKKIFYFIFILKVNLFCLYDISVIDMEKKFQLEISSFQIFPKPRVLFPKRISIESPDANGKGQILVYLEDVGIISLNSHDKDIGLIEFSKGILLPKISLGIYYLYIDDIFHGMIYVNQNEVHFIAESFY